jgi:hypothetical protein
MSVDVGPGLSAAIVGESTITNLLSTYKGAPSVHTRLPVPDGVEFPYIVIGPDVAVVDFDALTVDRPIVVRNIYVYGNAGNALQDDYREVEQVAYALRTLLHRGKDALSVDNYDVVSIEVTGPTSAPTSDDKIIGRYVVATIRLRSTA